MASDGAMGIAEVNIVRSVRARPFGLNHPSFLTRSPPRLAAQAATSLCRVVAAGFRPRALVAKSCGRIECVGALWSCFAVSPPRRTGTSVRKLHSNQAP